MHSFRFAIAMTALFLTACSASSQPDARNNPSPADPAKSMRTVLFLGDSITAGYGLSPSEAYPALVGEKIQSRGWPFQVANAGVSGDTTAAGLQRVNWVMTPQVDVIVVALGANDGLRGIPPDVTKKNLQAIIDKARSLRPDITVVLAGMQMPPNYGPSFTREFSALFPALAEENDIPLIPFLLKDVGGVPAMNLSDRIHPNAAGQAVIAETVWSTLEPLLQERIGNPNI